MIGDRPYRVREERQPFVYGLSEYTSPFEPTHSAVLGYNAPPRAAYCMYPRPRK